jgi:hypothetical protein
MSPLYHLFFFKFNTPKYTDKFWTFSLSTENKKYFSKRTVQYIQLRLCLSVFRSPFSVQAIQYVRQNLLLVNTTFLQLLMSVSYVSCFPIYLHMSLCFLLLHMSTSVSFPLYLSACKYYNMYCRRLSPSHLYLSTSNVSFCTIHTCTYKLLRALSITCTQRLYC